jgi:EpsI family protein
MRQANGWARFLCVWLLLLATALLLASRSSTEYVPRHESLDNFPYQIGDLQAVNMPINEGALEVLGPGQFLDRDFSNPSSDQPPVELFIAYYPSQRMGDTIHSPQNCLPGSGWTPLQAGLVHIPRADGQTVTANSYIVGKGMDRLMVVYWYQAHGRTTPSEYWAKFYLVADAIKMNRTDGALVRIVVPMAMDSKAAQAQAQAVEFAKAILPHLDKFIPL